MKKIQYLKKGLFVLATTVALGTIALNAQLSLPAGTVTVEAAGLDTAEVTTITEFESALQNSAVTTVNVNQSIQFRKNITNIPNRNLTINGNADKGVVINSSIHSIYGRQNTKGTNTVSIKNANILGDAGCGRFFTGGSGNGPSSYGWDVYAENVSYKGARFVHLSEGKLTFAGVNDINTRAENAWVHDLEFLPGTIYKGVAANKDHGQFSAFYFNGRLVKCKATGEVKIGDNANVNVKIGPQSNVNYYYPVFYDKVQKVDVGVGAILDVDAAGVAFQFIPRADYVNKQPSLNLAARSRVYFNGRGGGNYATMKLQYYGSAINVDRSAELVITGNSSKAVVESNYKGAVINLNGPRNVEIKNKRPNSKLFCATNTTINAVNLSRVNTWTQEGGDYPGAPALTFTARNLSVNFGKCLDSKTLGITGDLSQQFRMENYGKISLVGGGF